MTPVAWLVIGVVVVVGSLVGGLSYLRAHRRFIRREALHDQRYERAERQHRQNHDVLHRDVLAARAERDQLVIRYAALEETAATTATTARVAYEALEHGATAAAREARDALDRTADSLAVVEARLARTDRQRIAAEQRVAELSTSGRLQIVETTSIQRRLADLDAQRRRSTVEAIEREQHLKLELHRAQGRARTLAVACQLDTETVAPLYTDRPALIELDAISARIRGLTLVDCVTISDRHGLPLDRNGSRDADDLAALVPTVSRVAREIESVIGTIRSIVVYTGDSRVVELRALPSWTRGAWLAAQASAQRPTPAALDAAVAYAHAVRDVPPLGEDQVVLGARGRLGPGGTRSDSLGDELDRATRGLGARTAALVLGEQILAGVAVDGLTAGRLESVLHGLNQVAKAAHACLRAHEITRVELDIVGAIRISLAQLGVASRLGLITHTVGRALDPLEVERVVGRLRRFLDASPTMSVIGGSGGTATGAVS